VPEKLDRCVNDVKGQGKSEDSAYAICNSSIKQEVASAMVSMTEGLDKSDELMESHNPHEVNEHGTYLPSGEHKINEHDNPLDIPFGYELNVTETVCKPCVQETANKKAVMEGMLGRFANRKL